MPILGVTQAALGAAGQAGLLNPLFGYLGQFIQGEFPCTLPDWSSIIRAYHMDLLATSQTAAALRGLGISVSAESLRRREQGDIRGEDRSGYQGIWRAVFDSQVSIPATGDLLTLLVQGRIREDDYIAAMKGHGFVGPLWPSLLRDVAQNRIPAPSDLVRFAVKDVWDAAVVERFQYDAEFPAPFDTYMRRQGFGGRMDGAAIGREAADAPTASKLFWRAHWTNIAPGQAFEMFQRLRPNRVAALQQIFPDLRPFTQDDLLSVLRINDYPIPFRSQLAAIAYHKPRLVDIDRFFSDGAINEAEAYEYHLDLGYSPRDARLRTNWLVGRKAKQISGIDTKKAIALIVELYGIGQMERSTAFRELSELVAGRTFNEAREDNVHVDAIAAWTRYNVQISAMLDAVDHEQRLANSKLMLKAWRSRYLKGMINAATLRTDMQASHFTPDYVRNFIARLDTELAGGRLMLSTGKIRTMIIDGILPIETGRKYLVNLGWKDPELYWLVSALQRDVELEQLAQAERDARDRRTQEETQMKLARLAAQKRREVVLRLNRQATPAALRRYYIHSIIHETEYDRELIRRGFTDATRKTIIQDARLAREDYIAKKRKRDRRNTVGESEGNAGTETPPATPTQQPVGTRSAGAPTNRPLELGP